MTSLQTCLQDWDELDQEYSALEETHRSYCRKVEEVKAIQAKCMGGIAHQRYRVKCILEAMKKLKSSDDAEDKVKLKELQDKIKSRKNMFREMEDNLPHENGLYLKVILGSVNVSLLSKHDKYKYKENYEMFKLYVTVVVFVCAIQLLLFKFRVIDAAFQFLLVWYYCTLTIREHILKVNGSRIKGWWITHHFLSTVCAGILLIWPDGYTYSKFRFQFVVFSIYISIVQFVQYYYQKGCLYRLRALGERRNMDITVEGFQFWMWKGLTFVLPFLLGGYLFQLYNAYRLYILSQHELCTEWQVITLSFFFAVLSLGNIWTTSYVIQQKIRKAGWMANLDFILKNKYRFATTKNFFSESKVHQY